MQMFTWEDKSYTWEIGEIIFNNNYFYSCVMEYSVNKTDEIPANSLPRAVW